MHSTSNVIAFDRNRRVSTLTRNTVHAAAEGARENVVALADWQGRARTRRTASGVFFTTGVLTTYGSAA